MSGIELIAIERQEQIEKHGFTTDIDVVTNDDYELRVAAMRMIGDRNDYEPPVGWNKKIWAKMMAKEKKGKLIIAGALIAAEIDRLQSIKN